MKFSNLPIAVKLYSAFGLVVSVLVILGVVFYSFFTSVTEANKWNIHTWQVIDETRGLTESLVNMETGLRGYAIVGDTTMLEPYEKGTDAFRQHLAQARSLTSDNAKQQERLNRLEAQEASWASSFAADLLSRRKAVNANQLTLDALIGGFKQDSGKAQMDAMRATIQEIAGNEASLLTVRAAEVESLQTRTQAALVIGTLMAAVISALLAGWIARLIARPIREAVHLAQNIAKGDLTSTITATSKDESGALLQALSFMQARLVEVVSGIKSSADSIMTAANEVATGNADLSSRTEEQAASLEETASSMEELTSTVRQNADNARQASQLASSASAVTVKGNEVVNRVVATMGNISRSSDKIGEITGIIEGIAFQTNILALNASVEAARAGEQGRGFAVVAGEVRSLAQRASTAAKEIRDLIHASVEEIRGGTAEAGEAGKTMSDVAQAINRVTEIIAEIAAASHEQTRGIEQVSQAVMQMDQVTQQNSALVEEAAAAAQSLDHQGAELGRIVAVFRLATGTLAARPVQTRSSASTAAPAWRALESMSA
ncbi:methyl-accepting chemotaxis protein [Paraburkholderia pallida]|uniref:HAMP domain-containing protein n=1 Tax=Paraburkholderia pallida TaxID=2547399 RepID=A0A4P7D3F0_9BURK|nr:methyl-accepting chemotaxis protein [Paraburkholderia pallida]QBR03226.1 HAMP domain-containing protein [Paraburkholderia pallida]